MTWKYDQRSGELSLNGEVYAMGYAGAGEGKNNPDMQHVHNVGPLPRGKYTIVGRPYDTKAHGPFVLRLQPDPCNEMCGRAGFLIHGDSIKNPGTASEGCIIVPRPVREKIWASGDKEVEVV